MAQDLGGDVQGRGDLQGHLRMLEHGPVAMLDAVLEQASDIGVVLILGVGHSGHVAHEGFGVRGNTLQFLPAALVHR